MLISDEYRAMNREMHEEKRNYGISGFRWAKPVQQARDEYDCYTVLDYGCGKQKLAKTLGWPDWIKGYDPAIEGLDDPPEPADLVVCGDVLEHVEPGCLDAVLDDIARLSGKASVLTVATRLAVKTLPDGRNAHLIVENASWWLKRLLDHFDIELFHKLSPGEFVCVAVEKS